MKNRPFSALLLPFFLIMFFLLNAQNTRAAVGWVGDMYPEGGQGQTISAGQSFTVYVQVWQAGVTDSVGQGANITCDLQWNEVDSFGGTVLMPQTSPMSYNVDKNNNDEYMATITPPEGLYEFTAVCIDTTDGITTEQGDGKGMLTVNAASNVPNDARAFWVDQDSIAWNVNAASYELFPNEPTGEPIGLPTSKSPQTIVIPTTAGQGVPLTDSGTLTNSSFPKLPNVAGYKHLTINPATEAWVKEILKKETAVAAYDANGDLIDSTWLQIQGVLDGLYAANASSVELGVTYNNGIPTVRLWAPTAQSVKLYRYANASDLNPVEEINLTENSSTGVWSTLGNATWDRQFYRFAVQVWVPGSGIITNIVTDPYAVSLSTNSKRSQFVDLANDSTLEPNAWPPTKPALNSFNDISLYEVHVRDFSINDTTVPAAERGTFKAFTHTSSNGMTHLLNLQQAGLSHIHLLPVFDIASVDEDAANRAEPSFSFNPTTDRASQTPQTAIVAARATDGFNWGYDPYHYGVPEGSYSTDPNGVQRIIEFREMVQTLNANGLRVVMDVVYNHTNSSGLANTSVLDKIVPGYYHRYDNSGTLQTTSCCPDTASEFAMMEKLIIDTLKRWAIAYQVDGFRFDLMNLHTVDNAVNIRDAIQGLTINNDRVDGSKIFIYGEGWDFGSAQTKGLLHANQINLAGTGISTFNDRIRDAAHGGYSTDDLEIRQQGFINGLSYDWNGYFYNGRFQADLHDAMNRLRTGLVGGLANWGNGGYTTQPGESINYVSKHDNETLFDQNVFKAANGANGTAVTSMADRVRIQNMGLSVIGLGQGVPFFHLGSDMLRSKSLDRNSYDSGDWFNKVDFTYGDNNFGKGLPPAEDNNSRWNIMTPLLTTTALDPTTADIQASVAHLQELLQIRHSSPLFRLSSATDINNRVTFWNGDNSQDGLIVMGISDAVGGDLDSNAEYIFILFNANKIAQDFTIAEMAGVGATAVTLHPVQQTSADTIVQTSSFNEATGTFSIPARTTAVFLSTVAPTPIVDSDIHWVGDMYPDGGESTGIDLGSNSNHTVYVQVYKENVTGSSQGSNGSAIDCYLHWGEFGQTWNDAQMTFNNSFGGNANNDEYFYTIPTAALSTSTYGYTAYCTDDGGLSKRWRAASNDGDGILTIIPSPTPPPHDVFVHLFEWKWSDIEKECSYLAEKGYDAIQVSPPMEHVLPTAANRYAWWVRYQPVSYSLANSRSGTLAEFQSMVAACSSLGVDIYVDAVLNHTTGVVPNGNSGTGNNGSTYAHYDYPAYDPADFHYCGTNPGDPDEHDINDFNSRFESQTCELVNLADLNTGSATVQATIRAYLQSLVDMGVAGFRLDAAKHMPAHDIAAILNGLTGDPYIFQEVIDVGNEQVQALEYLPTGDVTEFNYANALGNAFNCAGTLADLATLGNGLPPADDAIVFADNHDNQRGHGAGGPCVVDHTDGDTLYNLANIFMLAHPYGYPKVMSSYHWDYLNINNDTDDDGPPSTSGVSGTGADTLSVYGAAQVTGDVPQNCDSSHWVCEHRRTPIANMVGFRTATAGEPLTNWWDNAGNAQPNQIAFGRDEKGFVAINFTNSPLNHSFHTNMPLGNYCDVTKGELTNFGTACTGPIITVNGSSNVTTTVAAMDSFAIHADAQVQACTATAPTADFAVSLIPDSPKLTLGWSDFGGLYRVWLSTTKLDFDIADGTLLASPNNNSYEHPTGLGDTATTHAYLVEVENCAGTAVSRHVGEFEFTIAPGQ